MPPVSGSCGAFGGALAKRQYRHAAGRNWCQGLTRASSQIGRAVEQQDAADEAGASHGASLLILVAHRTRTVPLGINPSDIGPGKGCLVAFGVPSPEGEVTVIGGDEAGQLWIATWGSSAETSPVAQRTVPHTLAAVRSAIAEVLDGEARASEARWMTFPEWAALEKSGPPAGGRP